MAVAPFSPSSKFVTIHFCLNAVCNFTGWFSFYKTRFRHLGIVRGQIQDPIMLRSSTIKVINYTMFADVREIKAAKTLLFTVTLSKIELRPQLLKTFFALISRTFAIKRLVKHP